MRDSNAIHDDVGHIEDNTLSIDQVHECRVDDFYSQTIKCNVLDQIGERLCRCALSAMLVAIIEGLQSVRQFGQFIHHRDTAISNEWRESCASIHREVIESVVMN